MSEQAPTAEQAPNAEAVLKVRGTLDVFENSMAGYVADSVEDFHHDVETTLANESWDKIRQTDQFVTTSANMNRLFNYFSMNPDREPGEVEQTYLAAVESFAAVVETKKTLTPKEHETLEKLDSLATREDGRKIVTSLIYDMADARDKQRRDMSLPADERYAATQERQELTEFGFGFSDMSIVNIDPDPHNNAMDAANDYLEYTSGHTTIFAGVEAVNHSIQHNALYAKYAAELADSVVI
jgi:hypothetical protein